MYISIRGSPLSWDLGTDKRAYNTGPPSYRLDESHRVNIPWLIYPAESGDNQSIREGHNTNESQQHFTKLRQNSAPIAQDDVQNIISSFVNKQINITKPSWQDKLF